MKKVGFHTLGCKLNFSESSTLAREFEAGGFVRATAKEQADIYVINTCSVTEHADKKCRHAVRKIIRENPGAIVAVTGCYAQLKPHDIAQIEGVALVIGNNEKGSLYERVSALCKSQGEGTTPRTSVHHCEAEELTQFFAAFSSGDRTRSFLKVQDGCDYHCSYCTIPKARGGSRNQPIEELVQQAREIARKGEREIVLTGVNTGDFGRTTGERFVDLLEALDQVEGVDRYRISSIEPNLLSDEVIALTARSAKFQPHFHIPLQSGCDRILALMRRRYTTERFRERIEALRARVDDPFLGIDVIVGFPGESEADFQQCYDFLEQLAPAYLHVFPYSVRPGTPAADFPDQVPAQVSADRVHRLSALSDRLHRSFCEKFLRKEASVLWESTRRGGWMYGYTEHYIQVCAPYEKGRVNTITQVSLEGFEENGLIRAIILPQ